VFSVATEVLMEYAVMEVNRVVEKLGRPQVKIPSWCLGVMKNSVKHIQALRVKPGVT